MVKRQNELMQGIVLNFDTVHIKLSQIRLDKEQVFRAEMQFAENQLITQSRFHSLDSSMNLLIMSDMIQTGNVTFDDMISNSGELFVLEILLLFSNVKGGCGVEWRQEAHNNQTDDGSNGRTIFFCV